MPKKTKPPEKNAAATALGRKGGRAWSKTLAAMTPEQRAEEMRRRVATRWATRQTPTPEPSRE